MTEQVIATNQAVSVSEEQALLRRLREGEDSAFGELFECHASAVRRLARGIAADSSEAEDITAETFFRVLQALRRGAGPRDHVRAYLLTVARRVSWEWHGARRDVPVTDDELSYRAGAGADTSARAPEHTLITSAFTSLPERWRTVLWQTEVEGEQPAVVAPHFGLSPNATAALARRARLGLRAAYLQAHLKVGRSSGGCRSVVEKLGGYTAGSVTGAEARRIQTHLLTCQTCRSTHDELRDVCSSMRAHAGAIVLLVPAAGLSFGGMTGIGTASSSSAAVSAIGETTAAAGSAAAGGGGFATMAKGVFLGAKMKVGLAVASTAAVGALGISVAPVMVENVHSQPMGLHGRGATELRIAEVPAPRQGEGLVVGTEHTVGGAVAPIAGGDAAEARPGDGPLGAGPQGPQTGPGAEDVIGGLHDGNGETADELPHPVTDPIETPENPAPGSLVPGPDPDMAGTVPTGSTSERIDTPVPDPTQEPTPSTVHTPMPDASRPTTTGSSTPTPTPSSRQETTYTATYTIETTTYYYEQRSYPESGFGPQPSYPYAPY